MRVIQRILFLVLCLGFTGCTTNDFKVLEGLRIGMTRGEARAAIDSFGFKSEQFLERPSIGWSSDGSFANLAGRAKNVEERTKLTIASCEYFPVGHGFLGAGQLFLFFGNDGRVVEFYRYQIN